MKILVLQLARFGDIYLTWPTLRALRRKYPDAEIHFLVREKFAAATAGLDREFHIRFLPTATLLAPILDGSGLEESQFRLDEWLDGFQASDWDLVINLSFSPVSSYFTSIVSSLKTEVRGYSRYDDGFLSIPDDASAYFYAQVGTDRPNRFHLADVFAMVADVDLLPEDWRAGACDQPLPLRSAPYVVIHLGASQKEKCYPIERWQEVIRSIDGLGCRIVLIGSVNESNLASGLVDFSSVDNLVGQTELHQLFGLLKGAELLVGADSAPIHMAAHVGTRVLNLSFSSVNFWETGPLSPNSFVMVADTPECLPSRQVSEAIGALLQGRRPAGTIGQNRAEGPRFLLDPDNDSFSWRLIQALYTQTDYPRTPKDPVLRSAIEKLAMVAELALVQFSKNESKLSKTALEILSSVDLMLSEISRLAPPIRPLVAWFETERIRIPPGRFEETAIRTKALFQDLLTIVAVLTSARSDSDEIYLEGFRRIDKIAAQMPDCAQLFRRLQMDQAEPKLQNLLTELAYFDQNSLHRLDGYRDTLNRLIAAFENQDYVLVADLIEYEIGDCLTEWRAQLVRWQEDVI